jgi:divalent metal cation (Fe/Co/Zn/Cd) transporter
MSAQVAVRTPSDLNGLRRIALALVWIGQGWNLLEAGVGLASGIAANSTALIGFGLDSIVELMAGGVLIWHLRNEWAGDEIRESSERRAYRLVGATFLLLAALISVHSIASLAGVLPEAQPSRIGIVLIISSAVVMTALYLLKTQIARRMHSHALEAEARQALYCDLQDVPVVAGLLAAAVAGWWWADPLVALLLVPLFIREALGGLRGESCGEGCAGAEAR